MFSPAQQAAFPQGRPIRYGTVWKNEKLYVFSPREGILVVQGWPKLRAWRKTPKGQFFPCRPEMNLGECLSVSRSCRITKPPTTDSGTYTIVNQEITERELPELDQQQWDRERDSYKLKALTFFAETFPSAIRKEVAQFATRQWNLAKLCQLEGGRELIRTNPGVAFSLANNWVFRANTKPWRSVRRLLKLQRRAIAGWLGFPPTELTVRILGKIPPSACYPALLLNLRRALNGGLRADLKKTLNFLPVLNVDALTLINSRSIMRFASPRLLRDLVAKSVDQGRVGEWHPLLQDILKMAPLLGRGEDRHPLFSLRGLERYHDRITTEYTAQFGAEPLADGTEAELDLTSPLPAAPIPGTDAIVPLTTSADIRDEAIEMQHCVLSYLDAIRSGASYIYRMLAPERATVEIRLRREGWRLAQVKGFRNTKPGIPTIATVEAWLRSAVGNGAEFRGNGAEL